MDLKLEVEKWRRRPGMEKLLGALGAGEGETRYVGGAVRDDLLGFPVNDVDLATRLRPDEVVERLQSAGIKAVPTGIAHGTVTAVSGGHPYEITTLRRDVETFGRRATVAFTGDWKEDAARRDFTINALMADPVTGEIFDYFGGLADLEQRLVRFIGDPFERIADELMKLLSVAEPAATVKIMLERAILKPVIPEIAESAWRQLHALVEAERESGLAADALRRLAALLPRDPQVAGAVATRLKLSNRARSRIRCASQPEIPDPKATAYRESIECAVDRLLLSGQPSKAGEIAAWHPPRLAIGGGALIKRGLAEGPAVSRALRAIEDRWIAAGFPTGDEFEAIVAEVLSSAR
jgi:poly(A) polymerase